MAIAPGQQLLHYRLIEKIGEGGMGVVWKAEDTKLHRRIALKVLPQSMAADPDRRARFEREARTVAALNHPNIVTLHSVEEADGVHFITMELVEGQNLAQLLPRGGFPLNRLLEIAIPLADAVSRAHRAGITHRDLKPDNVMIDVDGRLRVLDFGLAKLQESSETGEAAHLPTATAMTGEGKIVGTVAYMSPEQAEGKPVDHRSDIFSLGTILYEVATGKRPFQGDTSMSTIGAILKDEPRSITDIRSGLPRHLGRIVRRCLAKDPELRYQTALDVRNELVQLKGEIDAGEHSGSSVATAPSRRGVWPVLIAGAALVVALAAIAALVSKDVGTTTQADYIPLPVSASNAWDSGPNWSPDGKFVAFERTSGGELDIYVKPIDGGDAVARVQLPGEQINPRWTPDGRYLAYVSRHEPGSALYITPADGGEPRMLIETNIHTLDFADFMGDRPWSADGESLLISMPTETGEFAVHRVGRETRNVEQVTFPPPGGRDTAGTYSFDGKRILFRRQIEGRGTLMVLPDDGGEPSVLLRDEHDVREGAWRPNGRVLFNSARTSPVMNLFEIDVATKEIRQLTNLTLDVNQFSVSVNDRIAVALFRHDQFFFIVDVETGERQQITSHVRNNFAPTFSPDGRFIAYTSDRSGNLEVWLHPLNGDAEWRFTNDEAHDIAQGWSPDGRRILFLSNREGAGFRLYVANADGGTGARLLVDQPTKWGQGTTVIVNNPVARWSPDGETIAYRVIGGTGPELWTVRADGTNARKRLDDVTGFSWYLDAGRALITRSAGTEEELLAVDLDSGEESTLFIGPLQEIDVAPDGSAVAFCYGRGHLSLGLATLRLERPADPSGLPRAIGQPEYVVPTEGTWHIHSAAWSPDSKRLVYNEDTDHGDIYELVKNR